ncbi:galactose-binding like protein, partial [Rhizodiscina lignyota]
PPHFKDISSLASWTVSTAKPGCSVPQLRAPSTSLFWQSDGPQPHHLNIHFFKLVEIAGIRIYLDFDLDESYTPTKIAFLAGTGYNDLQEWCVMQFEQPRGWMDVDFSGQRRWPVLRAMLVQVQIRENHQNGKDTHLRGLQIFAREKGVTGLRPDGRESHVDIPSKHVNGKRKPRTRLPEPQWDAVTMIR